MKKFYIVTPNSMRLSHVIQAIRGYSRDLSKVVIMGPDKLLNHQRLPVQIAAHAVAHGLHFIPRVLTVYEVVLNQNHSEENFVQSIERAIEKLISAALESLETGERIEVEPFESFKVEQQELMEYLQAHGFSLEVRIDPMDIPTSTIPLEAEIPHLMIDSVLKAKHGPLGSFLFPKVEMNQEAKATAPEPGVTPRQESFEAWQEEKLLKTQDTAESAQKP